MAQEPDPIYFSTLIRKKITGTLSGSEAQELDMYLKDPQNRERYESVISDRRLSEMKYDMEHYRSRVLRHGSRGKGESLSCSGASTQWRRAAVYAAVLSPVAVLIVAYVLIFRTPAPDLLSEYKVSTELPILIKGSTGEIIDLPIQPGEDQAGGLSFAVDREAVFLSYLGQASDDHTVSGSLDELIVPHRTDYGLILSDGTRVYLNANSKLGYPPVFGDGPRVVTLEGMAYFDVASDRSRPFLVKSPRAEVRVTGTSFTVSDYTGRPAVTTLITGRVLVETDRGSSYELTPGEQLTIYGPEELIRGVDTYYHTSWIEGFFHFVDTPLDVIMEELSFWYGIDIKLEDGDRGRRKYTAKIKRYPDPAQVLGLLAGPAGFTFTISENTATIK